MSENEMLSRLEQLMSTKFEAFEQRVLSSQRQLTQSELTKIQERVQPAEKYSFRKKGIGEQHKVNSQVLDHMRAAGGHVTDALETGSWDSVQSAKQSISEGMGILAHRQKLIKLADSSESDWKVEEEYEAHPLAEDSDDEKKIYRAQVKASRKLQQEKKARARRFIPYSVARVPLSMQTSSQGFEQTSQKPINTRRPGLCFRCGRPGHWCQECQVTTSEASSAAVPRDKQISSLLVCCSLKREVAPLKDADPVTPVGKLKSHLDHWKEGGANDYILDVVNQGYKIPFKVLPGKVILKNNKSARDNSDFVSKEIEKLSEKGCISDVAQAPHVVNPLTVAHGKSGKRRLVLDCCHINMELFKFKCCFEDHSVARQMFRKGDFMFCFDIRSAYHHIMIYPDHRQFLGFAWRSNGKTTYYVFHVLPFGLSTAGFIFTKLLRVIVQKWRARGLRVVVFLDDGLGGPGSYQTASEASGYVHVDLAKFGFIIAEDKCTWVPCQALTWLGYVWNMRDGYFSITEERLKKLEKSLELLLSGLRRGQIIFPVKRIAGLVGQLISMQSVVGQEVRLRTRSLYQCVLSRASWDAPIMIRSRALDEIEFWSLNIRSLNRTNINSVQVNENPNLAVQPVVFCDASGAGFGGYIEGDDDSQVIGCWSESECGLSSTWRELEAIHRVLKSNLGSLEGHNVSLYTDNKNAASILKIGSRKSSLQNIAVSVNDVCRQKSISLWSIWIPRQNNVESDFLSRCTDSDDWSIKCHIFEELGSKWGQHTCDMFACSYNKKCKKFYSKYWCPGTAGFDAFSCDWQVGWSHHHVWC